jgi:oligoribonuclease NrnB/cAMP/cGMP phosphodiesterase (DHH superfamily)
MNIKLFSHTDLDGYGCNVIMDFLVGNSNKFSYDAENLDYTNVNTRIKEFIKNGEWQNYDKIFITDISVNEEVASYLDDIFNRVKLLDHHPSALWLNENSCYKEWATIKINDDVTGEKTSGTEMLFNMFSDVDCVEKIKDFVTQVKRYDTWLWKEKYNDDTPKKLNDLFYILGSKRFMEAIRKSDYNVNYLIEYFGLHLELQQEKIDAYINKKNKEIIPYSVNGFNIGVIFAEQFQSELGNRLSELNPQYDLIAMIGDKTVSYRTIHENISCKDFAELYKGGGHPKSSGSQINKEQKQDILEVLFK